MTTFVKPLPITLSAMVLLASMVDVSGIVAHNQDLCGARLVGWYENCDDLNPVELSLVGDSHPNSPAAGGIDWKSDTVTCNTTLLHRVTKGDDGDGDTLLSLSKTRAPPPLDYTGNTCYVNPLHDDPHHVIWFGPLRKGGPAPPANAPRHEHIDIGIFMIGFEIQSGSVGGDLAKYMPRDCDEIGVCTCDSLEPLRAGWNDTSATRAPAHPGGAGAAAGAAHGGVDMTPPSWCRLDVGGDSCSASPLSKAVRVLALDHQQTGERCVYLFEQVVTFYRNDDGTVNEDQQGERITQAFCAANLEIQMILPHPKPDECRIIYSQDESTSGAAAPAMAAATTATWLLLVVVASFVFLL